MKYITHRSIETSTKCNCNAWISFFSPSVYDRFQFFCSPQIAMYSRYEDTHLSLQGTLVARWRELFVGVRQSEGDVLLSQLIISCQLSTSIIPWYMISSLARHFSYSCLWDVIQLSCTKTSGQLSESLLWFFSLIINYYTFAGRAVGFDGPKWQKKNTLRTQICQGL